MQETAKDAATILVVDDSATVLRVAEFVLTNAGYRVTCVERAEEVVEIAKRVKPRLVLLDFAMPGMSGYDVCRRLGEDTHLEDIPIVIMNTRGDAVGERFIREMGIVDHITKPFAPEALLAVVQHTLDKTRNTDHGLLRRPLLWEQGATADAKRPPVRRAAELIDTFLGNAKRGPQRIDLVEAALRAEELRPDLETALFDGPGAPALAGDLSVVSIAEVLQLLQLQRQSGFLVVRRGEVRVTLAFKEGQVRLVTGDNLPLELLLGNILVRQKLMEQKDLEVLLSNRRGTRRRLGSQVVKLGYMTEEQLHQALRLQSSEIVYALLRWAGGHFSFRRSDELPPEVVEFDFGLGIDELLMEGFRRVDEWGLIEEAIGSFATVLRRAASSDGTEPSLTEEERKVLARVDGRRSVEEIIREVGSGTFEVAKILYRLISAKVVSVQPTESVTPDPTVVG
jgi:DNA-binding response OmpR family regulator